MTTCHSPQTNCLSHHICGNDKKKKDMLKTEHINNLSPVAGNTAFTNVPYCKAAWGIQTSCHHQIMQNKNGYLQDSTCSPTLSPQLFFLLCSCSISLSVFHTMQRILFCLRRECFLPRGNWSLIFPVADLRYP